MSQRCRLVLITACSATQQERKDETRGCTCTENIRGLLVIGQTAGKAQHLLLVLLIVPAACVQGKPGLSGLPGQKGSEGSPGREGQPGLDGFQGPQVRRTGPHTVILEGRWKVIFMLGESGIISEVMLNQEESRDDSILYVGELNYLHPQLFFVSYFLYIFRGQRVTEVTEERG